MTLVGGHRVRFAMSLEVETTESATRKIQLRKKAYDAGKWGDSCCKNVLEQEGRMGSRAERRQECTRSTGSSLQAAGLP